MRVLEESMRAAGLAGGDPGNNLKYKAVPLPSRIALSGCFLFFLNCQVQLRLLNQRLMSECGCRRQELAEDMSSIGRLTHGNDGDQSRELRLILHGPAITYAMIVNRHNFR
jgi:hypothetical protein